MTVLKDFADEYGVEPEEFDAGISHLEVFHPHRELALGASLGKGEDGWLV
jgi:hypothetical protein